MLWLAISTVLSTVIACAALWISVRAMRTHYVVPKKRMEAIETAHADLSERLETALAAFRTVTQRTRMRVRRQEEREAPPDGVTQGENESTEQWKARMRAAIASGKVNPRQSFNGAITDG